WICLTGAETFVPKASPVRRFAADELLAAARLARDAGARRLAVVAPLAALLQMGASASHIGSADEMELTRFGFERLIIVRPTAADAQAQDPHLLARLVRSMGRTLGQIMLPRHAQQLSPRNAALAIWAAVQAAGDGTSVLGARELLALLEARLPHLAPPRRSLR
ncbi:MAG: hypothetical protein ACK5X1_14400, partial [Betaproteobacteria bacterium]